MNEIATHIDRLREVALDQHGYVTAAQALEAGVSAQSLAMLARRGRVERAAHGVYRVPQVPATEFDAYQLALLWTGRDEASLGFETALFAWGVCDVNPGVVHLCVPASCRLRRAGGEAYVVHRADVPEADVGWWEGMRCVLLARAIEQCTGWGTPTYLLRQAVENGCARGLLTEAEATAVLERIEERDG